MTGMLFPIPAGDYVSHMLTMIFGSIWTAIAQSGLNMSSIQGASPGVFGDAFKIYNGAIFTFTTLYIVKTIYEGIAGTAYHGEWLGKTFHAFWTPMRIVAMLALVAPVANGYSVVQVVVFYTAANGIGLADTVTNRMISTVIDQGVLSSPKLAPSATTIAGAALRSLVCVDTYNLPSNGNSQPMTETPVNSTGLNGMYFGGAKGSDIAPDACGSILAKSGNSRAQGAMINGINAMLPVLVPVASQIVSSAIAPGSTTHGTTGSATGGTPTSIRQNQVSRAALAYETAVESAASQYAKSQTGSLTSKWKQSAKNDGFAVMGSFVMNISTWDSLLATVENAQPAAQGPAYSELPSPSAYGLAATESVAATYISQDNPEGSGQTSPLGKQMQMPTASPSAGGFAALLSRVLVRMNTGFLEVFRWAGTSVVNPIGQMQAIGIGLMTLAGGIYASSLVGAGGAGLATGNLFSKLVGGSKGATFIFSLVKPVLLAAVFLPMALGAIIAYVIPMMIYVIFFTAVLGFVAAVSVSVLGAPMFAAMHAIPDGEGFVPSAARAGYQLLGALFIKPSMIVFGFFIALLMIGASEYLVNETFIYFANSVISSTFSGPVESIAAAFTGFVGMLVMVGGYAAIDWKMTDWSFQLVHQAADKALQWAGLNDISMGEEGVHRDVYGAVFSHTNTATKGFAPKDAASPGSGSGGGNKDGDGSGGGEGSGSGKGKFSEEGNSV